MTKYLIYGLIDPRNGQLRYVGKTSGQLSIRLAHHVHRSLHQRTNYHKANWIRGLVSEGYRPQIIALVETDHDTFVQAETFYIRYFREMGCPLTNLTDGGEGCEGFKHSEEAKLRMSILKKGKTSPRKGLSNSLESKLLVSRTKTGLSFEQQNAIVKMYEDGWDSYTVGEKFGVSSTSVLGIVRLLGKVRNRSESRIATNRVKRIG